MKSEDLMLNDWVLTQKGEPAQVYQIYNGIVALTAPSPTLYNVECLHPIRLTPELLEKNGFVKLWNQYVLKADKEPFIHLISLDNLPNANGRMLVAIKDRYTNAKIAITYVHQLQHALRLCGIEKEIEL